MSGAQPPQPIGGLVAQQPATSDHIRMPSAVASTLEATGSSRFRKDSLLVLASTIAIGIGNYGFSLALIWVLPSKQFAVVAAVSSLVVVAATAAGSALPWVLAGEVARTKPRSPDRRQAAGFTLASSIATGLLAAVIVVSLSSPYASAADEASAAVWVLAVFVLQVGGGYLQGTGRFAAGATLSVIEVVIKLGLGIALAAAGRGAAGALIGAALATVSWAVAGMMYVGRDIAAPTRAVAVRLWRSAVGIGGVQVGVAVLAALDVIIGAIKLRGAEGFAGYQAMLVFTRIPMFISGAVSSVAYRRMVASGTATAAAVRETMNFYLSIATTVVAVVVTIPGPLLGTVLPHRYGAFVSLLLPLGLAGMAAGQINVTTTFFQAEGRLRPALAVLWPSTLVSGLLLVRFGTSVHALAWTMAAATSAAALAMTVASSLCYRGAGVIRRTSGSLMVVVVLAEILRVARANSVVWLVMAAVLGLLTLPVSQRFHRLGGREDLPSRSRRFSVRRAIRRHALAWTTRGVDLIRPLAPPTAWHMVLAARTLAGSGPVVSMPIARRALVLAPHPDDETIGCGGTVALLVRGGTEVTVAIATSGEMSVAGSGDPHEVSRRRRAEATLACEALGTSAPLFIGLPDDTLEENIPVLATRIKEILVSTSPEVIFVPWALDAHADHVALAAALSRLDLPAGCQIWSYEVWAALPANRIVDISASWDTKLAALACHASGRDSFDLDAHLALSRWRSIFALSGQGQAEAFLVLEAADFRKLLSDCRR